MEPRIQYAKTKDGVSIAYSVFGKGPPLVVTSPAGWSHVGLERRVHWLKAWHDRLAETKTVVRFDIRGTGLSERKADAFSADTFAADLDAVVDALGLDRFALLGPLHGGRAAIAFAARHPERLSHLVLWCTFAGGGLQRLPQVEAATALIDKDWELFTETIAHASLGWEAGEQAHFLAIYMRESVTRETYKAMVKAGLAMDVTDFLAQITVPTLVVHPRQVAVPDVSHASELASRIPGARLVLLEGTSSSPIEGALDALLAAINEFLGEGEPAAAPAGAEPPAPGAFRTVLFTDIEGSTAMTQRLGDAKAREVLREHERIVRECLRAHGGSEVKTMGDGFMASFGSATKALECAVAIQRAFAERNTSLPAHPEALEGRAEPQPSAHPFDSAQDRASTSSARADRSVDAEPIRVRIGLNAGEPIAEDGPDGRGDLFGTAVIRAARIAALAQGGEILVANVVRELAEGKGFMFGDRGEVALRGFDDPVRVFEVRWTEEG